MGKNDDENKNDELSKLLHKYYKTDEKINVDKFWNSLTEHLESLYHKDLFSERALDDDGNLLPDDVRYRLGLEEYILNKTGSIKHKLITDHLLRCKECRKNYNDLLTNKSKKKQLSEVCV